MSSYVNSRGYWTSVEQEVKHYTALAEDAEKLARETSDPSLAADTLKTAKTFRRWAKNAGPKLK